ncbi:MAG TPA: hypothetical protein VHC94_09985 [Nitrobacter sp.]|jgi:hypothetical protein|nr:hypothetical protein [Nitrobacter sp.]
MSSRSPAPRKIQLFRRNDEVMQAVDQVPPLLCQDMDFGGESSGVVVSTGTPALFHKDEIKTCFSGVLKADDSVVGLRSSLCDPYADSAQSVWSVDRLAD